MQLITAVVAPSRLDRVLKALRLFDVHGWTITRLAALNLDGPRGQSARRRQTEVCNRLEIIASNDDTPDLVRVIASVTSRPDATSAAGLWVTPLDDAVRIGTGQRGPAAV